MVEVVNQSSILMYEIKYYIAISLFMFVVYLIISILATYDITVSLNKYLSKVKYNEFIIPLTTVALFVLPIVLDLFFFVDMLKFTYYQLYMEDLHLHINTSKLVKPNINYRSFEMLSALIYLTTLYYFYRICLKKTRKEAVNN